MMNIWLCRLAKWGQDTSSEEQTITYLALNNAAPCRWDRGSPKSKALGPAWQRATFGNGPCSTPCTGHARKYLKEGGSVSLCRLSENIVVWLLGSLLEVDEGIRQWRSH